MKGLLDTKMAMSARKSIPSRGNSMQKPGAWENLVLLRT